MDYFDELYWNPLQILAWVYLGDRELVRKASDSFEDRETVFIEVVTPDGERKLTKKTADQISEIDLVMHAALRSDRRKDAFDNAKKEIIDALVSSRISASGIREGKTDRTPIDPQQWIDLDFFFHDDGRMYAGWTRVPRRGESRYKFVKVGREEIMRLWPDPFANMAVRVATQDPPERIKIAALNAYFREDVWTALEAIFLLHGKAPRTVLDDDAEIWAHFAQAHIYLGKGLRYGAVGRKELGPDGDIWIDTPEHWYEWARGKGLNLDARIVKHFDPELPGGSDDVELSRYEQLQRDANALAQQWKSEKRPDITKRKICTELTGSKKWESLSAQRVERLIRKQW